MKDYKDYIIDYNSEYEIWTSTKRLYYDYKYSKLYEDNLNLCSHSVYENLDEDEIFDINYMFISLSINDILGLIISNPIKYLSFLKEHKFFNDLEEENEEEKEGEKIYNNTYNTYTNIRFLNNNNNLELIFNLTNYFNNDNIIKFDKEKVSHISIIIESLHFIDRSIDKLLEYLFKMCSDPFEDIKAEILSDHNDNILNKHLKIDDNISSKESIKPKWNLFITDLDDNLKENYNLLCSCLLYRNYNKDIFDISIDNISEHIATLIPLVKNALQLLYLICYNVDGFLSTYIYYKYYEKSDLYINSIFKTTNNALNISIDFKNTILFNKSLEYEKTIFNINNNVYGLNKNINDHIIDFISELYIYLLSNMNYRVDNVSFLSTEKELNELNLVNNSEEELKNVKETKELKIVKEIRDIEVINMSNSYNVNVLSNLSYYDTLKNEVPNLYKDKYDELLFSLKEDNQRNIFISKLLDGINHLSYDHKLKVIDFIKSI